MKNCPFCAEEIQEAAIVCKHCHRDLPSPPTPVAAKPTPKSSRLALGCIGIIGVVVVASIIGSLSGRPSSTANSSSADAESTAGPFLRALQGDIRDRLQSDFTVRFERSTPVRGVPRVMGKTLNGRVMVELIGPGDRLRSATVIVAVPKNVPMLNAHSEEYLTAFLKVAAPEFDPPPTWLRAAIQRSEKTSEADETTAPGAKVKVTAVRLLDLVSITVEAQ